MRLRLARRGTESFVHQDLGFRAVCHPQWPDSVHQFMVGPTDQWELSLLRKWLRAGDGAVDVGANLGVYSFAALAAVGPGGKVIAVDADPLAVRHLQHAARLLQAPNLTAVHAAITDQDGTIDFHLQTDQTGTFMQSIRPDPAVQGDRSIVTVPAQTLQSVVRETRAEAIKFVKVDIEGAEASALATTPPSWLTDDGPLWQIEINPEALARFGASPADLVASFPPGKFDRWLLCKQPRRPGTPPFLRRMELSEAFDDSSYYNFLAIPRGKASSERRARAVAWLERKTKTAG